MTLIGLGRSRGAVPGRCPSHVIKELASRQAATSIGSFLPTSEEEPKDLDGWFRLRAAPHQNVDRPLSRSTVVDNSPHGATPQSRTHTMSQVASLSPTNCSLISAEDNVKEARRARQSVCDGSPSGHNLCFTGIDII